MASKRKDIQSVGITFGDWKLVRMDGDNWELCHRHVTGDTVTARRNGTAGKVRWHRVGRYYQSNTFHLALEYAADWDMRNGIADSTMEMGEYLRIYFEKLERFRTAFEASRAMG